MALTINKEKAANKNPVLLERCLESFSLWYLKKLQAYIFFYIVDSKI